jgi:hypothetical protein
LITEARALAKWTYFLWNPPAILTVNLCPMAYTIFAILQSPRRSITQLDAVSKRSRV